MNYSPIKLKAPLKDYLWGGRRLVDYFNKKTDLLKVAESWELSTHPDGQSTVIGGEFDSMTLSEYIKVNGKEECIGTKAAEFDFFPILIKLIDAKDNLSIQVHPDDSYALSVEGEYGKTEMWYIVDCEENSYLYYGLNTDVSKEEFSERIKNNTLLEILNKVEVKKGDVFFIPSGTIHAICSGILICEVQQNSNTTYRVYDYDRRDANGNARELHIEKAIAVSDLCPAPKQEKRDDNILASCKYFTVEKVTSNSVITLSPKCFRSLVILEGNGSVTVKGNKIAVSKGESIFIPAQDGTAELDGDFSAILSYV